MISELEYLRRYVSAVAEEASPVALLNYSLNTTMELLGTHAGFISVIDEESSYYTKAAAIGTGVAPGGTFPITEGLTGLILRARHPILISDFSSSTYPKQPGTVPTLSAALGVPVENSGTITSAYFIFHESPRTFSDHDIELCQLISEITAALMRSGVSRPPDQSTLGMDPAKRWYILGDAAKRINEKLDDVLTRSPGIATPRPLDSKSRQMIAESANEIMHLALAESLFLDCRRQGQISLLYATLSNFCGLIEERGLHVERTLAGAPYTLSSVTEMVLESTVRGVLTTIAGDPTTKWIRLGLIYETENVVVIIEADGCGGGSSSDAANYWRMGLNDAESQIRPVGGEVSIEVKSGWGTRIDILVPKNGASSRVPEIADLAAKNARLTNREREIARLVRDGYQDKEIAAMLSISPKTVEKHLGSVFRKTGVHSRTMLLKLMYDTADSHRW